MSTNVPPLFRKILIANRGEIACRIIQTAQRLDIHCIAIYSSADANARHVQLADEAHWIGPPPSRDSYLCGEKIIAIARETGAEAIHPGYGFLSENAEFAKACGDANICFIGPPVAAIQAMGSKNAAKTLMEKAKVPVVPGYHGDAHDQKTLQAAAKRIKYPVLLKAAAGGGGKGMRVVEADSEFADALASAQREALASFGDATILIEKYLTNPRHVEVQLFADKHGNIVHLFDRDCSLQRRHQKIIEEAPAPGLSEKLRKKMADAAIAAAKAIHYEGAGTIEFLVDEDGAFYFMEMNTRLQVEHPVTEMITQQDLVEWQLRVAAGQTLPRLQTQLHSEGHAFEARIYAEDPKNDFLPSIGRLDVLQTPAENAHVRVDTGVMQGDSISLFYDPLIAKLIVWDRDRQTALARLQQALTHYQVLGIVTNLPLLDQIVAHPAFAAAKLETGFISQHAATLIQKNITISNTVYAVACLFILLTQRQEAQFSACRSHDPYSPWHLHDNWHNNLPSQQQFHFFAPEQITRVLVQRRDNEYICLFANGEAIPIQGKLLAAGELTFHIRDEVQQAIVIGDHEQLAITFGGQRYHLQHHSPIHTPATDDIAGHLRAPMPGTVIALLTPPGTAVKRGDGLLVIEAMKMEHTIRAPHDGVVESFHFQPGDLVSEGAELVHISS